MTLPVARVHDGCVILPVVGVVGVVGAAFTVRLADGAETHPASFTVNVYVPLGTPGIE